jgi:hypothetical protein
MVMVTAKDGDGHSKSTTVEVNQQGTEVQHRRKEATSDNIAEVERVLVEKNLFWIRQDWIRWVPLVAILLGFLVIIRGLVYLSAELPPSVPSSVVFTLIGVLIAFIGTTFLYFYRSTTAQARGYFEELESKEGGPEERARLKIQYYTHENLRQVHWIFWLSLVAMFLGFLIIIAGAVLAYYLAYAKPNTTQGSPITTQVPSIVTSLSGVIVEFIAATFLFIYRSTMKQARDYVNILMRLNTINMSLRLLNSIGPNKGDHTFKDETRARIALEILSQSGLEKGDQNTRE